jgi:hypothetical protein
VKGNKKTGKKPMPKRKSAGWTAKARPKPHESPLWPHLQLIRTMRLGRHTWAAIAEAIHQAGGPKVAVNTVYQFYKRVADRARKGKGLPLGFEDPFAGTPAPAPAQPGPPSRTGGAAPAAPRSDNPKGTSSAREKYIRHQAEFMKQKAQQPKHEQGFEPHNPNED